MFSIAFPAMLEHPRAGELLSRSNYHAQVYRKAPFSQACRARKAVLGPDISTVGCIPGKKIRSFSDGAHLLRLFITTPERGCRLT